MPLQKEKVVIGGVLITAIAALLIPVVWIESNVLHHTQGTFIYPRDNIFVNMTVARNLAFNEVWGISKHAFQSASSSPLYTILLAAIYFVAGAQLIIPLIVNALMAMAFLFFAQRWLIHNRITAPGQLLILLGAIFCTRLPLLVVSGTEHNLQLLCSFLFIQTFLQIHTSAGALIPALGIGGSPPVARPRELYLFAALMVLSGYPCSILAVAAGVWLCAHRQWQSALKLAAAAFLPILLFGALSMAKGGYFLPNPLLLDGTITAYSETFLVENLIIVVGVLLARVHRPMLIGIPILLVAVWIGYSVPGYSAVGKECIDLYQQQYQSAKFVQRYYNRYGVAFDDPGVISYWTEGRKLDLSGSVDYTVMRSMRTNSWSPAIADSLSKKDNIRIAILSDQSHSGTLPRRWSKVASWETASNRSTGRDSLSFYAIDTFGIDFLKKNLQAYQPLLPQATIVRYY